MIGTIARNGYTLQHATYNGLQGWIITLPNHTTRAYGEDYTEAVRTFSELTAD